MSDDRANGLADGGNNNRSNTLRSDEVIMVDHSIESAMHLYEKAGPGKNGGTYSLPSRRVKKKKKAGMNNGHGGGESANSILAGELFTSKSSANLTELGTRSGGEQEDPLNEEEVLVAEVRQKLNALLLYKYQHSKTAKDLAEVRQALNSLQSGASGLSRTQNAAPQPLSRTRIMNRPRATTSHRCCRGFSCVMRSATRTSRASSTAM